ncbi:hypothetical protein AB0L67_38270 [Streptomyces flaveolus]|uniref:hypothetical protein n=1 Tax=Streptomyces flaveolus TaxID=67297 RepID=UPI00343AEE9E
MAALQEAATNRLIQLDAAQRPVIMPGRTARIGTTITPACLRLLTGTVQQPNRTRSRFDFLLDEASTERLRRDPSNTRFHVENRGTHGHLLRRRCSRPNVRQRHERCTPARAVTRRPGQRPAGASTRSGLLPGDG